MKTRLMKSRVLAILLSVAMVVTMMPFSVFATEGTDELNSAPTLQTGVTDKEAQVLVNEAYLIDELQGNKVFEDADGDTLSVLSYFYERSTDGGKTWSDKTGFTEALFGPTIASLTESEEGTYMYRFYAYDGKEFSKDTWTLTLNVVKTGNWDINFFVGRDQNYSANGNVYPVIKLYKTAGTDKETNHDYVGWFTNDQGEKVLVFDPADYNIEGNAETGYTIDGKELHDYEPAEFTDSTFGKDTENGTESNTVVKNGSVDYNMFYATVEGGYYSYRAYGYNKSTEKYDVKLGGMKVKLPADSNVDGNAAGGRNIYLRLTSMYVTSKKADNVNYFTAKDYTADVVCPLLKCNATSGAPYKSGNYTYYPFMLYAGGNSCLYNYTVNPSKELSDSYMFSMQANKTVALGNTVLSASMTMSPAMDLVVKTSDENEFDLYFQINNFNTKKVDPTEVITKRNVTAKKYKVSKGNSNYSWRLVDKNNKYVTKAGFMNSISAATTTEINFAENDPTNSKSHDFSKLGTTVATRDEADLMVNLDPRGYKAMGTDESQRVRNYRSWQIINSDTANIMVEPEYNYQVLSGNVDLTPVNGGNAKGNWVDVNPNGTAIVAVTYDALSVNPENPGSHGGLYPANNPERTGVFVVSDTENGKADAFIAHNNDGKSVSRPIDWDYNYDTWYYSDKDENPELNFTVKKNTGNTTVSYALVTTSSDLKSSLSAWNTLTADEEGIYSAPLKAIKDAGAKGGTVIIKMTDATGTSYRLAKVSEATETIKNISNPGEKLQPGDNIEITFDGLYRGVNKIAGIFNPTKYYAVYKNGDAEVTGTLGQYQQMDRVSLKTTVPEELQFDEETNKAYFNLENGYVFGSMFSAANPFGYLYSMADTGVGTNFNAVQVAFCIGNFADIKVPVDAKQLFDVKVNVVDENGDAVDAALELKDKAGETLTADENGIYKGLGFGKYEYSASKEGYVKSNGNFVLGSATSEEVKDGVVTKTITLEKVDGVWDGKTMTEPAQEDGTYIINNAAEFAWFAGNLTGGNIPMNSNAKLGADINLGNYEFAKIGSNSKKFSGTLDGNGHKIAGLLINDKVTTATLYTGLFAYTDGATIKNITVEGKVTGATTMANGSTTADVGGLVGYANNTTIENVVSDIDVSINRVKGNHQNVGGVVGIAIGGNTAIRNTVNKGNVSGYQYVGGIVGRVSTAGIEIDNCINDGKVTAESSYAGGISAGGSVLAYYENCINTGDVVGSTYMGGIVADSRGSGAIKKCLNTGKISSSSTSLTPYVGSVTGYTKATVSYSGSVDTGYDIAGYKISGAEVKCSVVDNDLAKLITLNCGTDITEEGIVLNPEGDGKDIASADDKAAIFAAANEASKTVLDVKATLADRFAAYNLVNAAIANAKSTAGIEKLKNTNIEVFTSVQAAGTFLTAPETLKVNGYAAEAHGYIDTVTTGVSALDVAVASNLKMFGEDFEKNPTDYLAVSNSGWVTTAYGMPGDAFGYAVNGKAPHDNVMTDYGYTGYMINQAKVANNDKVEFFFYQDEEMYLDSYVTIDGKETAERREKINLTVKAFPYMWYSCYDDATIESHTEAMEGAQIALINAETGETTKLDGAVTDAEGKATVSFNKVGTYWITVLSDEEEPSIMPIKVINITNSTNDAAATVIGRIQAIGEVTLDKKAEIESIRADFEKLSDVAKEKVFNIDVLEDAEAALEKLVVENLKETKVKVFATSQAEGGYLAAPKEIEVNGYLAESYGFDDEVEDGVSTLDVLIAEHKEIFEEEFTKETAADYIVSDNGWVKKVFGETTSNFGFAVNGRAPHDDVKTEYGYTAYTVNQAQVNEKDKVEFFLYQTSDYSDYYADVKANEEVLRGEDYELEFKGFTYAYDSAMDEEEIAKKSKPLYDHEVALVDLETGEVAGTGTFTDKEGKAKLSFDKEGEYLVTLLDDEFEHGFMPIASVKVTKNDDLDKAEAVISAIEKLPAKVELSDEQDVVMVKDAYDKLTEKGKTYVEAEAVEKLDAALVKVAEELIDAIDEDPLSDITKVEKARAFYFGLSKENKAKVTNLEKLEAAEKVIEDANKKANFDKSVWTLSDASVEYTGKPIKVTVYGSLSGNKLVEGTDYKVTYANNTNVGTANVTITGIGNLNGSVTKTFKITPQKLDAAKVTLSCEKYSYNGSSRAPIVKVQNKEGVRIYKGTAFTVSYKNNVKVGTGTVTIKGVGNYSGTVTKSIKIYPARTYITKFTKTKTSVTVKWKKVSAQATGYRVRYAKKASMSNAKAFKITNSDITSKKFTKLSKNTTYYVQVRTYKVVGGKTFFSSWSDPYKVTTTKK